MKKERNYGIDLLRIISMAMVVILHVLGQGGVLASTEKLSLKYELAWALEIAAYCAVNCYAIISGYVGSGSKFKLSGILSLWLQVAFYSVGITVLFAALRPETVGLRELVGSFFPVMTKKYWYFSSYFGLFFFTPFLNLALQKLSRRTMTLCLGMLILLFSPLTIFFGKAVFSLSNGYSLLWLMLLYLIGGYLKKYKVAEKIHPAVSFLCYLAVVGLSWLSKYLLESKESLAGWLEFYGANPLVKYTAPTILFAGIFLVLWAARLNFKFGFVKKLILWISPYAFSVYLIHTHGLVWQYLFTKRYAYFADFSVWQMLGAVLLAVVGVYTLCTLIDVLRGLLFRLLHIKPLLQKLDAKLDLNRPDPIEN